MQSNLRTLGASEAHAVLTLREQERTVVRFEDLRALAPTESSARVLARGLVRKGWLVRAKGGTYLFQPPELGPENLGGEYNPGLLATTAVVPSYVGWWSAASRHGFTTQVPATVFVATRRRVPNREFEGTRVRFIAISEQKFFGFANVRVLGREVPTSTPAKTFIDCLDRIDLCGGPAELTRIADRALATVPAQEIFDTAVRFASKVVLQRLGFLSDLVQRPLPDDLRSALRAAIPKSARSRFGRRRGLEGNIGYVHEWGLYVDAERKDLLCEVPRLRDC
jgi:predicted transcriptional regulator of viral defense system